MADLYKIQYANNTLTYPGWNGFLQYENPMVGYPITYLSDEHVSVTGNDLYIPGATGIQLQSSYDPYYRIDYEITNGEIVDGLLVPTGPCTVYARDKINYFTATGNFEKGSNVSVAGTAAKTGVTTLNYGNVSEKYALHTNHTGDIPSSWYATSNRWNPSNASAYSITLNPKMTFYSKNTQTHTAYTASRITATTLVGTTQNQNQSYSHNGGPNFTDNYNKTFTVTAQSTYGVSAKLGAAALKKSRTAYVFIATAQYIATGTTGTWTATGIAP